MARSTARQVLGKVALLSLAVVLVGASGSIFPQGVAAAKLGLKSGPRVPLPANPEKTVDEKPKPGTRIPKVFIRTPRFGGRVQRDSLDRWVVDGTVLGLETVNIGAGQDAIFDTTLPAGLNARELRGRYVVPATDASSSLEVDVSGETVLRVPSEGDRLFVAPIGADFAGLRAGASSGSSPGALSEYVEFTARSQSSSSCLSLQSSQIDRLQLVVGGEAQPPSMLADFFPLFLDRLIVRLDPSTAGSSDLTRSSNSPTGSRSIQSKTSALNTDRESIDPNVAQTVLRLTTFIVKRWPSARVVVTDNPIAITPYDRQVAIAIGEKGSINLEDRNGQSTLVLSGSSARLPSLAEYLASPALDIAFSRSVQTEGKTAPNLELVHTLSVGDLRGKALSAKGAGTVEQAITVTQAQLGGQVQSIAVKMSGVAQVAGAGRLVVQLRANDQVLATKRVLNDEPFTLQGTISRGNLARDNVIVVRASELSSGTAAADQFALTAKDATQETDEIVCGRGRPQVTVQLDAGSLFTATMGRGLPAGFDRFPQAFVNGFDVRFTRLHLGELQAAADVVQLLQGLSSPRLNPKVFGPSRAHSPDRPMLYVGPPTKELKALDAPIIPEVRVAAGETPISALQGFAATGDDHLVLVTNGSSANLVSLLAKLKTDLLGWRSLRGDVVVKQNGRVRNIRVRTSLGVGEERGRAVQHSRNADALRFGLGLGLSLALFGTLISRLFKRGGAE
jgi:hypothetical protein